MDVGRKGDDESRRGNFDPLSHVASKPAGFRL